MNTDKRNAASRSSYQATARWPRPRPRLPRPLRRPPAPDRRAANQLPRVLGVSGCFVLGGEGLHRSGRGRAVRVDQLPVEATIPLVDDVEVGVYGRSIALDQRATSPTKRFSIR